MSSLELRAWKCGAATRALGMIFGCVLGLGVSAAVQDTVRPSIASAPSPAGVTPTQLTLRLSFSEAHAESFGRKKRKAKRAANRRAEEKRREEGYEKKLRGTRHATLPADCVYDSYASFSTASEIQVCGGVNYQRYEEDGVTGYEGHPVGMDRGEIKRARARRAEAKKKRQAEAKKKLKATLSTDCEYDSIASFSTTSNVYTCSGVQYRQFQENGVTAYKRHVAGSESGATKEEKARRVEADKRRQAEARKKQLASRKATLPKGCVYDTYASFFTSSNVYACAGVRYRQYQEKGVTGFEVFDL